LQISTFVAITETTLLLRVDIPKIFYTRQPILTLPGWYTQWLFGITFFGRRTIDLQ